MSITSLRFQGAALRSPFRYQGCHTSWLLLEILRSQATRPSCRAWGIYSWGQCFHWEFMCQMGFLLEHLKQLVPFRVKEARLGFQEPCIGYQLLSVKPLRRAISWKRSSAASRQSFRVVKYTYGGNQPLGAKIGFLSRCVYRVFEVLASVFTPNHRSLV